MIFDISHSKCGTTSLSAALRLLGYRTCHGCPPEHEADLTNKLLLGRTDYSLLNDYDAVSDLLNFAFRQLERSYPAAKFIYLDRDDEAWLRSSIQHLNERRNLSNVRTTTVNSIVLGRLFNIGCLHSEDAGYLAYQRQRRRQEVFDYFTGPRSGKLLVMRITDGWEPLCRFLGHPIPDAPFPWLNISPTQP